MNAREYERYVSDFVSQMEVFSKATITRNKHSMEYQSSKSSLKPGMRSQLTKRFWSHQSDSQRKQEKSRWPRV